MEVYTRSSRESTVIFGEQCQRQRRMLLDPGTRNCWSLMFGSANGEVQCVVGASRPCLVCEATTAKTHISCLVCEASGALEDYIIGLELHRFWGGILFA